MAQPSQTLSYVCRSCRKTLNADSLHIRRSRDHARQFSNSRSFAKTLATFTPTSSPELDALLNSWRKEVFLPSILSPHHQDLVYKTSRKEILTTAPGVSVTVQTALSPSAPSESRVEEETIKLEPMNRFDRPHSRKSFNQITQYLAETPDAQAWDNLIPFLEGLRVARIEPDRHFLPRLARKASESQVARWNTILTALTMSKRTGLTLANRDLTHELVLGTLQRALESQFSHPEPDNTLQRIVLLLDSPEHCGGKIPANTKTTTYADMRRDKTVLAVQTTFAAAKALRASSKTDIDGSVADCLQKLLLPDGDGSGSLLAPVNVASETKSRNKPLWKHNATLIKVFPLYSALTLTQKLNAQGKEKAFTTSSKAQKMLGDVESRISAAEKGLIKAQNAEKTTSSKTRAQVLLENMKTTLESL